MKPIIEITAGDINGVGYEILLKGIADPHICEICKPIVYGNAKIAKQHALTLGEEYHNISFNIIQSLTIIMRLLVPLPNIAVKYSV